MKMPGISGMDLLTEFLTAACVEASRFSRVERYKKGRKLRILIAGYNGGRNTGADVRVEAIVRQLYHILGEDNIHLGIMTLDKGHSSTYFKPPAELIEFNSIYFRDLLRTANSYHMAVLSEGSLFKSNFANALATFFIGTAGIMKAQGKPCIAYGSEAGHMDTVLRFLAQRYCRDTYVISRSNPSYCIAGDLGFKGALGTDTGWIFQPASEERAGYLLRQAGWNGIDPLIGVAAVNPFYWPVRPNLFRYIKMKLTGQKTADNYDMWYFFSNSAERKAAYEYYLESIAGAVDDFVDRHHAFPVLIGMDRLDREACQDLRKRMKHQGPIYCSTEYNGYDLVAILRRLSMLLTSRYHARVLSMPGGVPSIAISRDERLENLLQETGEVNRFYLPAGDPQLSQKLPGMMERLWIERENVGEKLLGIMPEYLYRMAGMGKTIKQFIKTSFPDIDLKPDPENLLDYLPPLTPELRQIVLNRGVKSDPEEEAAPVRHKPARLLVPA